MALAFLCSQARKQESSFRIADNPVSGFRGLVVDHRLREGSREEGLAVCDALKDLDLTPELLTLNWSGVLGDCSHPKELPNFESVARRLRYRKLGYMCAFRKMASLLTAHHEDDQYETVLMRLLQGHGSRGLRGMRKARDIPECEGMFGADRSGFVDDQREKTPYYKTTPTYKERRKLHRELRSRIRSEAELDNSDTELPDVDVEEFYQSTRASALFETPSLDIEDGGVTVYRPLLEFSKDRLIATCLENKVPWWEDATNKDPTLTMRNAVRHLYKGHTLPKALQKPAILALSKRCELRAQAQEAEANRLLSRTIIRYFGSVAGSIAVQFPELPLRLSKRDSSSPLRRQARLRRWRAIAAILLRRLLLLVSPEPQPLVLATLENHVARLFPSLASPDESAVLFSGPPKAFNLSGVHLAPYAVGGAPDSVRWRLLRAPYPSTLPVPCVRAPHAEPRSRWRRTRSAGETKNNNNSDDDDDDRARRDFFPYRWSPRMPWALWDGRYWVHVEHRLPYPVAVRPFLAEHNTGPSRVRLVPSRRDRGRLSRTLNLVARGKHRYVLPAIYVEAPPGDLLLPSRGGAGAGAGGGADAGARCPSRPSVTAATTTATTATTTTTEESGDSSGNSSSIGSSNGSSAADRSLQDAKPAPSPSEMTLVALPTLGVQMPGLDEWVSYEIRYRKVDRDTLNTAGTFHRGPFVSRLRAATKAKRKMKRVKVEDGLEYTGPVAESD
ncbi:hypothetical protein Hte_003901 [Hypoxylon texense]